MNALSPAMQQAVHAAWTWPRPPATRWCSPVARAASPRLRPEPQRRPPLRSSTRSAPASSCERALQFPDPVVIAATGHAIAGVLPAAVRRLPPAADGPSSSLPTRWPSASHPDRYGGDLPPAPQPGGVRPGHPLSPRPSPPTTWSPPAWSSAGHCRRASPAPPARGGRAVHGVRPQRPPHRQANAPAARPWTRSAPRSGEFPPDCDSGGLPWVGRGRTDRDRRSTDAAAGVDREA